MKQISSNPNILYNNILNSSAYISWEGPKVNNTWNTTRQSGTRVYSNGIEIGGNYFTNSTGGYSDTCTDSNKDGFCDSPFDLLDNTTCTAGVDCSNNTDYLPLSNQYDGTNPLLSIQLPANITYNYNTSLPLNYTVSDLNLDECWFNLDDGNNTTIACVNATFNASEGS